MDASRIVRRIYENLEWHRAFGAPVSDPSGYVWNEIKAHWGLRERDFIKRLFLLLLGRPVGPEEAAALRALLARGAPRSMVVRQLALSDEARAVGLDVSWLPSLDALDNEAVWPGLRALWRASNRAFVEGAYRVLLRRPADAAGAAGFLGLLAAGGTRTEVVRLIALSDEARAVGLQPTWLPRLGELERRRVRFGLRSLRSFLRRWLVGDRGGRRAAVPAPSLPQNEENRGAARAA